MIFHESDGIVFRLANGDDSLIEKAKQLRHDVYLEMGYIEKPYPGGIITDLGDAQSDYLVAVDNGNVYGSLRFTPMRFISEIMEAWRNTLAENETRMLDAVVANENAVIVGALAVKKGQSNKKVSWGVYKASVLHSFNAGISHWVIAIDSRALRAVEISGWSIDRIGKPLFFMGSISMLGIVDISKQPQSFASRNKKFYAYYVS